MKSAGYLFLLGLGLALPAHAGGAIYKCVGSGTIAYQSAPCADGTRENQIGPLKAGGEAANEGRSESTSSAGRLSATESESGGQANRPAPRSQASSPSPARNAIAFRLAAWTPSRRTTLALGMYDDEVLNLPNWGRPAKITRTKSKGIWREEWTYDHAVPSLRLAQLPRESRALSENPPEASLRAAAPRGGESLGTALRLSENPPEASLRAAAPRGGESLGTALRLLFENARLVSVTAEPDSPNTQESEAQRFAAVAPSLSQ